MNDLIVFEKPINCFSPRSLKYSELVNEIGALTDIKLLNKYWKFLNTALLSTGDSLIGTTTCGPKSISTTGLEKFKNSCSNWSNILLSNTEKISSILE